MYVVITDHTALGISKEMYAAAVQVMGSEIMQIYCRAQADALRRAGVKEFNPDLMEATEYKAKMQIVFTAARVWEDMASTMAAQKKE